MDRRSFIRGALGLIAIPAIVPLTSLMPVRGVIMPLNDANRNLYIGKGVVSVRVGDLWHDIGTVSKLRFLPAGDLIICQSVI